MFLSKPHPTTPYSKHNLEAGFGVHGLLALLVAVTLIGLVGWRVMTHQEPGKKLIELPIAVKKVAASDVRWQATGSGGWKANGKPPQCPEPILAQSPIDISKAREVGYPGSYRGGDYKAHGFLSLFTAYKNNVDVILPLESRLVGAVRYYEIGEVQYLLTFENPCGIQVRFDHLLTLSPEFAAIAQTLPPPTESTQSVPPAQPPSWSTKLYPAGTLVASAVGHTKDQYGSGFDFGLYDLRSPNEISKNKTWANLHKNFASQTFYGRCWLEMLPAADAARVLQILPLATDDRGASDYCSFAAGGKTLDYNGGEAVLTHDTPNVAR